MESVGAGSEKRTLSVSRVTQVAINEIGFGPKRRLSVESVTTRASAGYSIRSAGPSSGVATATTLVLPLAKK
jgi:hypothetical protein